MSILTKLAVDVYDRTAFSKFDPKGDFSLENAKALMWLSQLSYETDEPAKVAQILERFGAKLLPDGIVSTSASTPLPMPRTEAIVVDHQGATLVAFAGTDPLVLADWVADFDVRPNLGTTQGFSRALQDAMPAIRRIVSGAGKPVFVTGHSLGGALAVVAAQDLAMSGTAVAAVYTYGMPRPGDASFAAAYDNRLGAITYRLVHGGDVVPTVAPAFLGFQHVGRLLSCQPAVHFDARNLSEAPGSNEPQFLQGIGASLSRHFQMMLDGRKNDDADALRTNTGPTWAGRPDFVQKLIEAQPLFIQDHLPDSYINVLR